MNPTENNGFGANPAPVDPMSTPNMDPVETAAPVMESDFGGGPEVNAPMMGATAFPEEPVAQPQPIVSDAAPVEPAAPAPAPTFDTAPVEPAAPASAPAFGAAPADQPMAQPAMAPMGAPAPKKGGHGGLIALIVILVLLVGGAVAGVLLFTKHESADRMVTDAITDFITAETMQSEATLKMSDKTLEESELNDFNADMYIAFGTNAMEMKLNIEATPKDDSSAVKADLDVIAIEGDAAYLKIEDIKSSIESFDMSDLDSSSSDLIAPYTDLIKKIDGQWYKVNASDIKIDTNSNSDVREKIAEIYAQYPFLTPVEGSKEKINGSNYFTVTLNKSVYENFLKEAEKIEGAEEYIERIEGEDFNSEVTYKIGVKTWSHDLTGVIISEDGESFEMTFDTKSPVSISAPSGDVKDIESLAEDISALYSGSIAPLLGGMDMSDFDMSGFDMENFDMEGFDMDGFNMDDFNFDFNTDDFDFSNIDDFDFSNYPSIDLDDFEFSNI